MPIVDIRIVTGDPELAPNVARRLADAIGRTLGCAPGRAWVRVDLLNAARYAENDSPMEAGGLPVFATVLHADPPQGPARAAEALALATCIAEVLGRPPDRVHVEYASAGRGRIAFGGKLVE